MSTLQPGQTPAQPTTPVLPPANSLTVTRPSNRTRTKYLLNLIKEPISTWGLVIVAVLLCVLFDFFLYETYAPLIANWLRGITSLGGTLTVNSLGNCFIEIKKIYTAAEPVIEDLEDIVARVEGMLTGPTPNTATPSVATAPSVQVSAAPEANDVAPSAPASVSFCILWTYRRRQQPSIITAQAAVAEPGPVAMLAHP